MNLFTDNYLKENLFFLINECMKTALKKGDKETKKKKDGSIITIADREIHNLIVSKLSKLYPDIPIISEEGKFKNNFFLNKALLVSRSNRRNIKLRCRESWLHH